MRNLKIVVASFGFLSCLIANNCLAGGVTIITHGFNSDLLWVDDAADKVVERNGGNDVVSRYYLKVGDSKASIGLLNGVAFGSAANVGGFAVVELNWSDWSGYIDTVHDFGVPTEHAATLIVDWLLKQDIGRKLLESPIHLIGHSRGASLVGAMAVRLGDYGYWVDQVSFLDSHPIAGNIGVIGDADWGDSGMFVPGNVIFADSYYRRDIYAADFNGEQVSTAYNVRLDEGFFDADWVGITRIPRGYPFEHSDVHAWYRGTIPSFNPSYSLEEGAGFQVEGNWYSENAYDDGVMRARDSLGYAFSLTANGGANRPAAGLHVDITGFGKFRAFDPDSTKALTDNVGYLSLHSTSVTAGKTLVVDYRYESWASNFGVEFYLDTNRNPYDGHGSFLGSLRHGVSHGMKGLDYPVSLSIPADQSAENYYVFIKSTGSNGTRYFYAPTQLTVNSVSGYVVSPSSGGNGSISPSTDTTVESGGSITFTASADAGYSVDKWYVGGLEVSGAGGSSLMLSPVTAGRTVLVTFKQSNNKLEIARPAVNPYETGESRVTFELKVPDGTEKLTWSNSLSGNDGEIGVDSDGSWDDRLYVDDGQNVITFRAYDAGNSLLASTSATIVREDNIRNISPSASEVAYVSSGMSKKNSSGSVRVGYERDDVYPQWQKQAMRGLVKFGLNLPGGCTVKSAQLKGITKKTDQPGAGFDITVYRVVEDWSQDSVTWNSLFGPGDTVYITNGHDTKPVGGQDETVRWGVSDIVASWNNGADNYGFILKAESSVETTHVDRYREFAGGDFRLEISYEIETDAPSLTLKTPADGSVFGNGTTSINLTGRASDKYLTKVTWKNLATGSNGTASGTRSWSCSVNLSVGVNEIVVSAIDESGNVTSETLTVIRAEAAYNLSVVDGSGSDTYAYGTVVDIALNPLPLGKVFDKWVVSPAEFVSNLGDATASSTTFTIPLSDVLIVPQYKDIPVLTVTLGSGSGYYMAGSNITVSADIALPGQVFDNWTGDTQYVADVNSPTTTLTMPSGNATVTATYKELPFLTINYGSGSGYYLVGSNTTVCADVAERGYEFDQWTVVPSQYVSNLADVTSSCTTFIMPAVNVAVTAMYKSDGSPALWSINPSSATYSGGAESGSFSVVQDSGADADWTPILSAEAQGWVAIDSYTGNGGGEVQYSVDWNDTGAQRQGFILVGNARFTVTQQPALAPSSLAGSVATVGDSSGDYAKIAYGADGNYASMESSSGSAVAGAYGFARTGANTLTVTQYTANAEVDVIVHCTFTSSAGGTVLNGSDTSPFTLEPTGDWAPQSLAGKVGESFIEGETVRMAYRSDGSLPVQHSASEDEFAAYTYAKTGLNTGEGTINAGVSVDYTFVSLSNVVLVVLTDDVPPETNTMAMVLQNGTLFWLDVESGSGEGAYAPGETASIAADAPQSGYQFKAWTGSGLGSVVTPTSLTMPSRDITITATYEIIPPTWTLAPDHVEILGSATSGSITLTQIHGPPSSSWTAQVVSGSDWLNITTGAAGTGNGLVSYSVMANETGRYRTGEIQTANKLFTVKQTPLSPAVPSNPNPVHNATDIGRTVTLSWDTSDYALGYEVWFAKGADTLTRRAVLSSTSYNTGLREKAQPFQWQVIAFNEGGSTNGAVWKFSTENSQTPNEVFGQTGVEWNHFGAAPWFAQTVEKYSGSAAMQSGAIGDGQVSVLEATVVGPGTLDFWWKVSSEENDFLNFYIGTNLYDGIAGIAPSWMQESVSVPDGVQTLSWKYEKDGSGSSTGTDDCGWLDDVQWKGENRTTFPLSGFADKWVATYLWDKTANEWIVLSNPEKGPTEVVVKNIKPDQWYWLCVMEYDGTNWNLAHGSWISHLDEM